MSTATKLDHLDLTDTRGGLTIGARIFDGHVAIDQEGGGCPDEGATVMLTVEQMDEIVAAYMKWKNGGEWPYTVKHSY